MNIGNFKKLLHERFVNTEKCLISKNEEYAPGKDKLANFRDGGNMNHVVPERYLFGLVSKHWIALRDFIIDADKDGYIRPIEQWDEKIGDIINYMILLEALVRERRERMDSIPIKTLDEIMDDDGA